MSSILKPVLNNSPVVKQRISNRTGFQLHPENINKVGRPLKSHSLTDLTKEIISSEPELKEKLVRKVVEMALDGDLGALKLIWCYMDGNPVQSEPVNQTDRSEMLHIFKPTKNTE